MLLAKLVPQIVEVDIVRTNDDVAELMQQRVCDLLHREELPGIMVISQADEDSLCAVNVQACGLSAHYLTVSFCVPTQQLRLVREKLGQCADLPAALPHHGLDHGCSLAERVQGLAISR